MRLALLCLCALLLTAPARAQTCLEAVDDLSEVLGFDTTLPEADSGRATTERLQSSGGVLEPPDVGAPVALEPPEAGDEMATAPPVDGDSPTLDAGRLAQVQSLLTAARRAGQRGDEEQCVERLAQATQLAQAR